VGLPTAHWAGKRLVRVALHIGLVNGLFGSLRVVNSINEIRDKARRVSHPDDLIDVMCVPLDLEDRVALTFDNFPLSGTIGATSRRV